MEDTPLISVVIPAHNAAEVIDAQLSALHAQPYDGPWEIVVADNGSTDDTVNIVQQWSERGGRTRLVDASQRRGANFARNAGAAAARGSYLLFCDADDVVGADWLSHMASAAVEHGLIGGPLDDLALNDREHIGWRTPHQQSGFPVGALNFLPYAFGGNVGIDAALFHEIGGFNEEFVYGGAEVDLSWRAQLAGAELVFVPDAVVHVRLRSSLRSLARQSYARGTAVPHLARAFADHPIRRPSVAQALRQWFWIVTRAPRFVLAPQRHGRWVRITFTRLGRLRGSIRHRIVCL